VEEEEDVEDLEQGRRNFRSLQCGVVIEGRNGTRYSKVLLLEACWSAWSFTHNKEHLKRNNSSLRKDTVFLEGEGRVSR
jgi:hypothetical protein